MGSRRPSGSQACLLWACGGCACLLLLVYSDLLKRTVVRPTLVQVAQSVLRPWFKLGSRKWPQVVLKGPRQCPGVLSFTTSSVLWESKAGASWAWGFVSDLLSPDYSSPPLPEFHEPQLSHLDLETVVQAVTGSSQRSQCLAVS